MKYALRGLTDKAESILSDVIDPINRACIPASLGRSEEAVQAVVRDWGKHSSKLSWLNAKKAAILASIRPDSRFQEILRAMDFPDQDSP